MFYLSRIPLLFCRRLSCLVQLKKKREMSLHGFFLCIFSRAFKTIWKEYFFKLLPEGATSDYVIMFYLYPRTHKHTHTAPNIEIFIFNDSNNTHHHHHHHHHRCQFISTNLHSKQPPRKGLFHSIFSLLDYRRTENADQSD